ncbi:MAG: protein kinase [Xanthomonadales bacterium]|nr:protein kinase [Xanthomonadales bacterium]
MAARLALAARIAQRHRATRDSSHRYSAASSQGCFAMAEPITEPSDRSARIGGLCRVAASLPQADARIGLQVGHWRIESLIASGGMGSVYRAQRDAGDFAQAVAVKLLRASDADANEWARRFAAEQRILAQLDHPYIARLLDGGTLVDGTPYLVMELVEGERIDHWCEQHQLDLVARLRLFAKVCRAVQAAHRMLVVHRDLKPGNILVDAHGEPKLLDFGIAKVIGEGGRDETRADRRLMTPRYAAPEQFSGHSGVSVDVYALGVILYELLTRSAPYDADGNANGDDSVGLIEAIRGHEPLPPSLRPLPAARARRLRGDLDAIVLKALRTDPARRYAGVEELVEDIERHLQRLPVRARQGSRLYHLGRFLERNRLPLAVSAAVLLGLLASGLVWRTQRDAVVAERDKAARASQFLSSVLSGVSPGRAQGLDRTLMRLVLEQAGQRLATDLGDAPQVRAEIAATLVETLVNLGEPDKAVAIAETEYAAAQARLPPDARALLRLASETANARGESERGKIEPELLNRVLEQQRRLFGIADADSLISAVRLVKRLREGGDIEAARRLGRDTLRAAEALAHDTAPFEALLTQVALADSTAGDHDAAIAIHGALIAARERRVDADDFDLMELRGDFGATLFLAKRYDESLAVSEAVLPRYVAYYGAEHPNTLIIRSNIIGAMSMLGRAAEALVQCEEILAIRRRTLGERHPDTLIAIGNLAATAMRAGAVARAEAAFREYIPMCDALRGADHPGCVERRAGLGKLLRDRGQYAEAESWLLAAYQGKLGSEDRHFAGAEKVAQELVLLYEAWRRPAQAARWRERTAVALKAR